VALTGKEALIVDDDPSFRMLLSRILEKYGIQSVEASGVSGAFQKLNERIPHFIFLDMNMPGEGGLDFLEKKAKNSTLQAVPVIVLSANSDRMIVHRALSQGAKDYILKPIDSDRLIKKLRRLVQDQKFLSHELPRNQQITYSVGFRAEVCGVNESRLQVLAPVRLAAQSDVALSGRFYEVLQLGQTTFKTTEIPGQFSGLGSYLTLVDYSNASFEASERFKKVIQTWPEIKSNHPKDTARLVNPTVLVIDDDENFNLLIGKVLGKIGVKSETFSSPDAFLKRLKKGGVDACLLDLNIGSPRTGFKMVEAIRNIMGPFVALYVVSGESEDSVITEALEMGCNGYVVKSVDVKTLSEKLAFHLLPKKAAEKEGTYYQVPKEFSSVKVEFTAQLAEVDELGFKMTSTHLPAKGTSLLIQVGISKPISLTVTQTWIAEEKGVYGFYAENDTLDAEYSIFVRSLMAKK
jgi:DNA-binding response OmpR family regulator